jgi:sec-independent protein translocase protein TatA
MNALQPTHLIIVAIVVLLFFGPQKLPELAKGLGQGLRDFKKALHHEEEAPPPAAPAEEPRPVAAADEKS